MGASKILIVENETSAGVALMEILERNGHTVLGPAPDCSSALEILWRERPDFAFVDTHLGAETCEAVLDECDLQDVPVIVTHGIAIERPAFAGDRQSIQKPADELSIQAAISALAAA